MQTLGEEIHLNKESIKHPSINITLPLRIKDLDKPHSDLRNKFFLIKKFNPTHHDALYRILKLSASKEEITNEDNALLNLLWKNTELDDLDLTELFVCYLPEIIESQDIKILEMIDPNPKFHKYYLGDDYKNFTINAVNQSASLVKRFALPRVRAKLAVREIICLITTDSKQIIQLIDISPRYLNCTFINELIVWSKNGKHAKEPKTKQKALNILKSISRSISGNVKQQPRQYGYWKIDYFFNEVLECIKNANKMPEKKRHDYIKSVDKVWNLPSGYPEILVNGTKKPTEITLEMMIAKGMITDASTYRNVIMPYIKKLKIRYPYIRACDQLVEHLLDLSTKSPHQFSRFDIWKQLESFKFDLSEKELKIGHAISYPAYAIRV